MTVSEGLSALLRMPRRSPSAHSNSVPLTLASSYVPIVTPSNNPAPFQDHEDMPDVPKYCQHQ